VIEVTIRGNCPDCRKPIAASAVMGTDKVAPVLPVNPATVTMRGKAFAVAEFVERQEGATRHVSYRLIDLTGGDQC
jgi:hypothetical protein